MWKWNVNVCFSKKNWSGLTLFMVKYVILIKQKLFLSKVFLAILINFNNAVVTLTLFCVIKIQVEFSIWQTHNEPEIISTDCGI
jgi:hypothetical protein